MTFGSPRTGNAVFADYVMKLFPMSDYSRIVHASDPVPHLPPTALGFKHAGNEIWYTDPGFGLDHQFCLNNAGQPEDMSCSGTVWVPDVQNHLLYVGEHMNNGCGQA